MVVHQIQSHMLVERYQCPEIRPEMRRRETVISCFVGLLLLFGSGFLLTNHVMPVKLRHVKLVLCVTNRGATLRIT